MFWAARKKPLYIAGILLLFVLAEVILRLIDYPASYQFFRQTDGRYTINLRYRYWHDNTLPVLIAPHFAARKDSMTYRIFCLGDEAAQGFPYAHHTAYPVFLQQLLDSMASTNKFEVINCALPGLDSRGLRDMGYDLIRRYQPDLLLVMITGYNETGAQLPHIPYINCKNFPLSLIAFVCVQYEKIARYRQSRLDDRQAMEERFRENITQLVVEAREAQIPVLICSDGASYMHVPFDTLYESKTGGSYANTLAQLSETDGVTLIAPDTLPAITPVSNSDTDSTSINDIRINPKHARLAAAIFKHFGKNALIDLNNAVEFPLIFPPITELDQLIARMLCNRFYPSILAGSGVDSTRVDTMLEHTALSFIEGVEKHLGQVHIKLGDRYKKKIQLDEALQEYQAAFAFEATANAYASLGFIYMEKSRRASKRNSYSQLAEAYFQQSLYYNTTGLLQFPDNIDLIFNLGLLYFIKNNKLDKALGYFKEVLAQKPNSVNTMKYIAQIYLRLKEYARAKDFLNGALEIYPDEAQFHADLSMVYVAENNIEEAEKSIKQAFSLKPTTQMKYLLYQIQSLKLKQNKGGDK